MEGSKSSESVNDQGTQVVTPYYTPYQKQGLQTSGLQPVNIDISLNSGGDNSLTSLKEGSGSPFSSSSSLSSESVSFNSSVIHHHGLPVKSDDVEILPKETKLKGEFNGIERQNYMDQEDDPDNISRVIENITYEELLRKFIKNAEELRISNLNIQISEKEIINLKNQMEKHKDQLDHVQNELKMREADLEYERGQVLELQKQTAALETHVPDCFNKIAKLMEELEVAREQLKASNDEATRLQGELLSRSCDGTRDLPSQLEAAHENIAALEAQLDSGRKQVQELEDRITWHKTNETKRELEMQKLKSEMLNAQEQISLEKSQLQSGIATLSEEKLQMDDRLKELESRSNILESKLEECEAEKLKLRELHATQQLLLEGEITRLKEELGQNICDIEALNKEFDRYKHKYDVLMTEKDEANARIHKLEAEVSFRDNQIENKERELSQLLKQQAELSSESETKMNQVNELRLKVEELEKEVAGQNAEISDRAEEKREAIRQLCFSLDHYRSGYQELLQAFIGHKRRAVVASS
ncbi:protein NETWORKED 4B-like [Neltuma alba]|uniref:protein NETWORKED 4B-like n=1 Tax=Neltuma alba TaxID=207710 RepID=UPI0010A3F046|nr:protein NETWORKED 4B-like [Prosopis alba]XP_028796165.1 protein NETWORKED 4B-like [Prosopis alba]